tara:strand:- start:1029 stop:2522 length:1494 start_codon:yes stop_codon:yes gene_type:complete
MEIYEYFNSGQYNSETTNENLEKLKSLDLSIDINYYNFNKLEKIQKKRLFPFLNKKNKDYDKIYVDLVIDLNVNKDEYMINYYDMKYYEKKVEELLDNDKLIENNDIDPYNFSRFSNINNLNNIESTISITTKNKYDISYIKSHNKIERLGIYILPKDASPGFKNFRRILNFIKDKFDIYLFLDNKKEDLDDDDMEFIKDINNTFYLSNLTDKEVADLIYDKKLTILLSIYGFYMRKEVMLMKPAPIIISYQEPPVIYPESCYDYNLIDIYLYNSLQKYANIDETKFKFINLDIFILPIPFYSTFNNIIRPYYNPNKINIGLITYSPKISYELVNLVNRIIKIKNVYITIYGYNSIKWLKVLFPSEKISIDSYDNTNPVKLQDNILFIDSINYNNHSTALEILKLKIPFIGFKNIKRYHGLFSESLIKTIDMEDYLLADNINDYVKKVKLCIFNEKVYYKLYDKFVDKLNKSQILSDEYYTEKLTETINKFYSNYKK